MATVVLDSKDVNGIVLDATGEGLAVTPVEQAKPEAKQEERPAIDDDAEGEDGLTAKEKAELTAKMLKAVGKRVREKREAEEFAQEQWRLRESAERRAADLEKRLQGQVVQEDTAAPTKPERHQFSNDTDYINAVTQFAVAEALAKQRADDLAAQEAARQAQILEAAKARIARAIEVVPDFEDVTSAAEAVIPAHVAGYMQESEMFAELGYFLAKHPAVVEALQKMKPAAQLVEIGKIESRLVPFTPAGAKTGDAAKASTPSDGSAAAKPAPRDTTGETQSAARKAAPVITPINVNGSGSVAPDLEDIRQHIAEYARRKGTNILKRQRH